MTVQHRPLGSGHPFSVDTDQRHPVDPRAGEPITLGVRASADIARVLVELVVTSRDGSQTTMAHVLSRTERSSRGKVVDGGHLAAAQAKAARESKGWAATFTVPADADSIRYRFVAKPGKGSTRSTRWFESPVFSWRDEPAAVREIGTSRVIASSVRVLTDGTTIRRVRCAIPIATDEHVAGFGERFESVDQRGNVVDSVLFEQYKSQGEMRRTYMPMPFAHVVGGDGWGMHVRTSRRVLFDIGHSDPGVMTLDIETDHLDDGEPVVDIAFYDGTPVEVLDAFLDEVGRPSALPPWVFRLWASGNEWNTQAEVMRQADLHRDLDIPVGSIVIEAWSDESTFTAFRDAAYVVNDDGSPHALGDFAFPAAGAWPDPKGMVDELHERDVRVHLWQIPLLKMRPHPSGQAAADARAAVAQDRVIKEPSARGGLRPYRNRGWWFPLALMPDLTDPAAADWWTSKRRYLVEEVGIDGFKTDGGEHAWGRDLVYLDGRRGDEMNARFPVAYAQAYGRLLASAGKAPVTFSRAGFTGSQAHGAFWAGDENSTWDAFRWSMMAGLNASACGILYWGWDIAGFSGEIPSAELYLRAMAASVFVPIMQYHSEFNHHRQPSRDRTPWNIAERTGDERVIDYTRAFVHVRERLVSYLAEEAVHSIATSSPLMRPTYFDHPADPECWHTPIRWHLGRDMFVQPVVDEGADQVEVLLPPGQWIDALTGEPAAGRVVRKTPLSEIPVYVRASAWGRLADAFAPMRVLESRDAV